NTPDSDTLERYHLLLACAGSECWGGRCILCVDPLQNNCRYSFDSHASFACEWFDRAIRFGCPPMEPQRTLQNVPAGSFARQHIRGRGFFFGGHDDNTGGWSAR